MMGARLSHVVVAMDGVIKRPVHVFKPGEGIVEEMREEPAGFLVYFPKGHVLRIRTEKELKQYGLDKKPSIINMEGLNDPDSPLGKLFFDQEEGGRADSWAALENQVIELATKLTGAAVMPEMAMARAEVSTEHVRPKMDRTSRKSRNRIKENA